MYTMYVHNIQIILNSSDTKFRFHKIVSKQVKLPHKDATVISVCTAVWRHVGTNICDKNDRKTC